ncbi:periplasmic mercury ion-binding protein [Phaeobacter gallaeciensis]|uniref:periplasmic mercury ion-binding protein n=1 Tax=Rhodobacterales TaxID=204455 RepID=UPI00237F316D|nr:periplasmic mercury ion-binding protein [Phaeobacter gallaeciensis]MDE4193239.1 periplasmic mercury ion-binding protein [Phaeobacter gallaeciensis]MDE4201486.1 periplasmic mercury ion-binding protein [Phaeobacter gallaeciensis]MDE4205736.1 periplasmic mercury ion-binding protein [Phaeobacter gallaeciensis]MDE4209809.1 periplasmic mercury ion-binding protein [Phaeobacter gallaeciensis]MDE4218177.1 periplasmic mercury ion-binding protein [Phaeobacter gallaeciensis]
MKHILLSSALAVAALSSQALAEEQTVEIEVSELTCPSCSFIVASSMRGVPSVEINDFAEGPEYGHGVYNVTFDDAEASVERIIEAVMANGYPAQVLSDPAS